MTTRTHPAPVAGDPAVPRPCFLVIDTRFAVPVFVFLDTDPAETVGYPGPRPRRVTLARTEAGGSAASIQPGSTIGADPWGADRFAVFASDGQARAAGFAPVEPRYVGPTGRPTRASFTPRGPRSSGPRGTRSAAPAGATARPGEGPPGPDRMVGGW